MSEIEILNEAPLTLLETKEVIDKIEKRDKEMSERTTKTKEYINRVTKSTKKEVKSKLEKIEISKLRPRHIAKIADLMPKDPEILKSLFAGEPITLKQEEITKILECLK